MLTYADVCCRYGDVVPKSWLGKLIGCVAAFLGVGLFAMPAGILGSGFLEVYAGLTKPMYAN